MATKVHVVDRKGRGLVLRWHDAITGKLRERIAGTRDRREAERLADEEAAKLARADGGSMTWREFRERFDTERLPMLSAGSQEAYSVTFKLFEKWAAALPLNAISSSVLSRFAVELRIGRREITVMKHLRQLRAALHWAYALELIDRMPSIPKPARGVIIRKMKGKPLSSVEFDSFLAAIPQVVPAQDVAAWDFFSRGLWWQGLRVGEALQLWWDRDDRHRVELERQYPLIWIRGHLEKGKKDRPHPLAPQFAALLRGVPRELRTGPVFQLPTREAHKPENVRAEVSRMGSRFGKKAGILVAKDACTGQEKHASFHDLRRSCALRWAGSLMPQELMEFMRHSSIQVTLEYYVGQRVDETAAKMWSVRA